MFRHGVSHSGSSRLFAATASRTHYYNTIPRVMRGGFRL